MQKQRMLTMIFQKPIFRTALIAALFGLSAKVSMASTVYNCTRDSSSCVIKVEEGVAGDKVRILDSKARKVAEGVIKKRKGSYAIVKIVDFQKPILKGYPVIVNVDAEGSSMQWAASFSFQE